MAWPALGGRNGPSYFPMDCFAKTTLCLVIALTRALESFAGNALALDNPYQPIVARNVFNLNPSLPVALPAPADPLPIITPNGITSIFGSAQVLFKAAHCAPGQSASEKAYILGEGQREDDISVTRIDEKNAIITFVNHGNPQEIRLVAAAAVSGSPSSPDLVGQPAFPNSGGLHPRSRLGRTAPPAPGNQGFGHDGNIPNSPGFGAGYDGSSIKNNPASQGSNLSSVGGVDNSNFSVQDPAGANGTGSDRNYNSDPRANFSAADRLADEAMVLFAKQHMQ